MSDNVLLDTFVGKAREHDPRYPGALSHLYWAHERVVPPVGRPYTRFTHNGGYAFCRSTFARRQHSPYWTLKFMQLRAYETRHVPREGRVAPPALEACFRAAIRARLPDQEVDQEIVAQEPQPRPAPGAPADQERRAARQGLRRQRPARDALPLVVHGSDSEVELRVDRGGDDFRSKLRRLCDENDSLIETERREAAERLAEIRREVALKDAALAARVAENERLNAQLGELVTCRWYDCDNSSVLGLRCAAGHGLCDEHAREFCDAIADHRTPVRCVVQGCVARVCETAFLRCGVPHEVSLKCVQRLARDEFETEANAQRLAEERRRREAPPSGITVEAVQTEIDLKRPCCGNPMADFSECLAVRCDFQPCQKYFCGVCLDASFDRSDECHAHIRRCSHEHFGVENYFLARLFPDETNAQKEARLKRHYEGIQNARMRAFFRSKNVVIGEVPKNQLF